MTGIMELLRLTGIMDLELLRLTDWQQELLRLVLTGIMELLSEAEADWHQELLSQLGAQRNIGPPGVTWIM